MSYCDIFVYFCISHIWHGVKYRKNQPNKWRIDHVTCKMAKSGECAVAQTDRQTDRQTDVTGNTNHWYVSPHDMSGVVVWWRSCHTDRQTDMTDDTHHLYASPYDTSDVIVWWMSHRRTDNQTGRHTDRQADMTGNTYHWYVSPYDTSDVVFWWRSCRTDGRTDKQTWLVTLTIGMFHHMTRQVL